MANIEKHLHEHFASLDESDAMPVPAASANQAGPLQDAQAEILDDAFAKVNTVAANSPAERAGLKPGDEIRNFGYVNRSNHDGLKKVAECVQGNEGVSLLLWRVLHIATHQLMHNRTIYSYAYLVPRVSRKDRNFG